MNKLYIFSAICLMALAGCWGLERNGTAFHHVAPGNWRGVFSFDGESDKIPITFQVNNTDSKAKPVEIVFSNGAVSFQPDSVLFWGDTLYCHFDKGQTYLKMTYQIDMMEGYLYDKTQKNYPVKFLAQSGAYKRYPDLYGTAAVTDSLVGKWQLNISDPNDTTFAIKANFEILTQKYHQITAKFVSTDSLMPMELDMEGVVQRDKIYISGFNGREVLSLTATLIDKDYMDNGALRVNQHTFYYNGTAVSD